MEELVFQNNTGKDVTTSLKIAEVFGKRHADVLRDTENLSCSSSFRERNFAFMFNIRELPNGGSRKEHYYQMTKDGFSFLVMGYTGEKAGEFKETFINEFNKRTALLESEDYIVNRAFEITKSKLTLMEKRLELQAKELQIAAPKVEYYEEVLSSSAVILTNIIAKELGMSAVSLNRLLHEKKVIYKQGGTWLLYHSFQDKGYAKTKTYTYTHPDGQTKTEIQLVWTEKGRQFIHELIKKEKAA